MPLAVFGARRWKRPGLTLKVDLIPGQLRDFFTALAGEGQKFDDASIGSVDLSGNPYDTGKLIVIEQAVARCLARWSRQSCGWRDVQDGAPHAPSEESLDDL